MTARPRRAPRAAPHPDAPPAPTVAPPDDLAAHWRDRLAAHIAPRLCDATRRDRVAAVMLVEALTVGTVDAETCVAVLPAGHARSGRPELIKLGWAP